MAATVTVLDAFVLLETDDATSLAEWQAAVDSVAVHPEYRPGMGVVHDWRKHSRALEMAEIEARSRYLSASPLGSIRWALLVERAVDYGMGRMAEALLDGSSVHLRVFQDKAEAEAWARARPSRGGR